MAFPDPGCSTVLYDRLVKGFTTCLTHDFLVQSQPLARWKDKLPFTVRTYMFHVWNRSLPACVCLRKETSLAVGSKSPILILGHKTHFPVLLIGKEASSCDEDIRAVKPTYQRLVAVCFT